MLGRISDELSNRRPNRRPRTERIKGSLPARRLLCGEVMRSLTVLANVLFLLTASPALAAFVQVLPGPIDRVVAAREHVALLRKGAVLVLREDGTPLARIDQLEGIERKAKAVGAERGAEQMLDLLDVAEIDRDTDFSDELLDNERTLAQRKGMKLRAERPAAALLPTGLAANDTDIWIASRGDLLRVSTNGTMTRAWVREGFRAPLAASEKGLFAAKETDLVLFELPEGARQVVGATSTVRKLAVSKNATRRAWATEQSVSWTGPVGTQTLAAGPVADVGFCGETLVALVADAVVVVSTDGTPQVRAHETGARRVFCSNLGSMPWILAGDHLLASSDEGRHWETLASPTPAPVLDVAASSHHLWLATADGLYATAESDDIPLQPRIPPVQRKRIRSPATGALSWLPKVSVRAGAEVAPNGKQWEALAFAAFPLDGRTLPIVSAAVTQEDPAQTESPVHSPRGEERLVDLRDANQLRDPNQDCLRSARRKAVELAMAEPERARSYVSRAGYAAWLPELRLLVSRRYGRSESVDVNSSSTALSSPLGIDTVNDVRYEARATWDLGKLVFSSDELAAQTQALHMAELRRDIEATVNRLYFERRALERSAGVEGRRGLRTNEIEAELDAISADAFTACLAGKTGDR